MLFINLDSLDITFLLSQIFGFIALPLVVISFQINNRKKLLKLQVLSSSFFALQYAFLNAFAGFFMNLMCAVRNYIFKKYDNKTPLYILIIIISLMFGLTLISYNGPISLLPFMANGLYSWSLWQKNLKITRIVLVISCLLYLIYNICVLALAGIFIDLIEMISAIIAITRFDLKNKKIIKKS